MDHDTDDTRTPFAPTIRTQADLLRVWQLLIRPLGFSDPGVWMMLIGPDDRPLPGLTEVAEIPDDVDDLTPLAEVARTVAGPHEGRWAFLRSRPGTDGVRDSDRDFARTLLEACHRAGIATEVVHLATDAQIIPLPYDELAASA